MANKLIIEGGKPLMGEVPISGMKNAALPIVFATVLVGGVCVLENIPPISDIALSLDILRQMGASVSYRDRTTVRIDTSALTQGASPDARVSRIRGSSYLVGAELGRFGRADCALPGGCDFGSRPLDLHVKGFEALGATVHCGNRMQADAPDGLRGAAIYSSMEPCSQRKSEPESCTQLILRHGFARVVFALYEPDRFVRCRGAQTLREAGVDVRVYPELAEGVRRANAHLGR